MISTFIWCNHHLSPSPELFLPCKTITLLPLNNCSLFHPLPTSPPKSKLYFLSLWFWLLEVYHIRRSIIFRDSQSFPDLDSNSFFQRAQCRLLSLRQIEKGEKVPANQSQLQWGESPPAELCAWVPDHSPSLLYIISVCSLITGKSKCTHDGWRASVYTSNTQFSVQLQGPGTITQCNR